MITIGTKVTGPTDTLSTEANAFAHAIIWASLDITNGTSVRLIAQALASTASPMATATHLASSGGGQIGQEGDTGSRNALNCEFVAWYLLPIFAGRGNRPLNTPFSITLVLPGCGRIELVGDFPNVCGSTLRFVECKGTGIL